MNIFVVDNIISFLRETGKQAGVGIISRITEEATRSGVELRDLFFEVFGVSAVTIQESGAAGAEVGCQDGVL